MKGKDCVTVKEGKDKVTITVTGAAYRNLKRMADALNKAANFDDCGDNTAGSVLDDLIIGWDGSPRSLETADGAMNVWLGMVVDGLDYTPEYSEPTKVRKDGHGLEPMPKKYQRLERNRKARLAAFPVAFEGGEK